MRSEQRRPNANASIARASETFLLNSLLYSIVVYMSVISRHFSAYKI
jgi:hypothetical protein